MTISSLGKANKCGYHSISMSIQELETCGYLKRIQQKDEKGRFSEMLWFTTSPHEPLLENPISENSTSENSTHKNNKEKKTKEKNQDYKNVPRETFQKFWDAYPRKVAKKSAEKIFLNLEPDDQIKAIDGAEGLKADPNLPEKQFIPHPATWLNRGGWEDEAHPSRDKSFPKNAELPTARLWVKRMHDMGEHFECRKGEFGCK
jgi:hypothetical protein